MITAEQNAVLTYLKRSFGQDAQTEETLSDPKYLTDLALRNGILPTVYNVLPASVRQPVRNMYLLSVKQSILQAHEGEQTLQKLGAAGFQCIALKGWEMRKLYPDQTMRQMADLDILVRPYRFDRIKAIMEELGFASGSESSWKHDDFSKGEVHVEMHKRLTDDSGEIRKWEEEMWTRTVPGEFPNTLKMSPEDFYIFHFVHLHKDFMNGSLGLRRIADTWLLQKQPVDGDMVKGYLQKFGLWTFHERMVKLSRAAMGDEPMDENCEILLAHAFRHGIYGSDVSYKAGRIAAMGKSLRGGKCRSAIKAVFLPYKRMKAQFPILEKRPVLLPWCWMKRIVQFLKDNPKRDRRKLDYSDVHEEDFEEMKRFFEAGGVR